MLPGAPLAGKYRSLASCWIASYMLRNLWHVLLSLTLFKCTTCNAAPRSHPTSPPNRAHIGHTCRPSRRAEERATPRKFAQPLWHQQKASGQDAP